MVGAECGGPCGGVAFGVLGAVEPATCVPARPQTRTHPHAPCTRPIDELQKPDNIFLAAARRVIKLGDLGVAKHMSGTFELAITCLG